MFRGYSSINLDAKGRLAVPTRYRPELQASCESQLIVTLSVNENGGNQPGCLWLYPLPEWEQVEKKINALPTMNRTAKKLRQFIIGYAFEVELDGQGRFIVPEKLRSFAHMQKQVVLLGQLKKFEIWSNEVWDGHEDDWQENGTEGELEELGDLSF